MEFGRAITFPFDDDEWPIKVIIGTLLSFVPFFGPGYQVRVARNMIRGSSKPLPENNELGQVFVDGVMATLAAIIYFLPLIIVGCLLVFPAALSGQDNFFAFLFCLALACMCGVALLYGIPAGGMYVMGVIRYAETGNFSSFLQFGALWRDLTRNLGLVVTMILYVIILVVIGMFVSPIAAVTVVGAPLLGFWYQLATGHLIGQVGLQMAQDE